MPILQKPDCFRRGCNRFHAGCAQLLGDRWNGDMPAARCFVALPDRFQSFDGDYLFAVDLGPVLLVGQNSGMAGVDARDNGCAVHIRRARINAMMVAKYDPLFRELPKRRRIYFGHEVRAHSVPHNDHNVLLRRRPILCERSVRTTRTEDQSA